jgi:imidazoleglycerol-phosphate dehydratase
MVARKATVSRDTAETQVRATVTLEGTGKAQVSTGNGVLDHLLSQLAKHALLDLDVSTKGDPETGWHHSVEDTAIALGRALGEAVGAGAGIRRMGHALVPLDEALAQVAIDFSGRGFASVELGISTMSIADLPGDLVRHFLQTLAVEARITLHVKLLSGVNAHHMAEAAFKALAKALRDAVELDPRAGQQVPSTKGTIST